MSRLHPILAGLAIAFMAASAGPGLAAPGGACLGPAEQQAALSSGQVRPLPQVLRSAGIDKYSSVPQARLCKQNGQFVYHVTVLDAKGNTRNVVLPAGQ